MAATQAAPATHEPAAAACGLADLRVATLKFVRSWIDLLEAEIALAKCSVRSLLLTALIAPALILGLWLSVLALLIFIFHAANLAWPAAVGVVTALQLLLIVLLLKSARRWLHDLSMPRSRELVAQTLELPR